MKQPMTYEERENYACKVCQNVPDEHGELEHGRGCYVVSEDGGGTEWIPEVDPNENQSPTFLDLCQRYPRTDKHTTHSYAPVYQELLGHRTESIRSVLEIGVNSGDSLHVWHNWFPNAMVWGLDNREACMFVDNIGDMMFRERRIRTMLADASDPVSLAKACGELTFDLIVDDGSHVPAHQLESFRVLWENLNPGGLYVIEDVDYRLPDGERLASRLLKASEGIFPYVHDLRHVKGQCDDVLIVVEKPCA